MRLTIVNLFISGRMYGERKRSAGILARKPGKLNPPYAGRRVAADTGYKVRAVTEARRGIRPSSLRKRRFRGDDEVAAFAGTTKMTTPPSCGAAPGRRRWRLPFRRRLRWAPCRGGD